MKQKYERLEKTGVVHLKQFRIRNPKLPERVLDLVIILIEIFTHNVQFIAQTKTYIGSQIVWEGNNVMSCVCGSPMVK